VETLIGSSRKSYRRCVFEQASLGSHSDTTESRQICLARGLRSLIALVSRIRQAYWFTVYSYRDRRTVSYPFPITTRVLQLLSPYCTCASNAPWLSISMFVSLHCKAFMLVFIRIRIRIALSIIARLRMHIYALYCCHLSLPVSLSNALISIIDFTR